MRLQHSDNDRLYCRLPPEAIRSHSCSVFVRRLTPVRRPRCFGAQFRSVYGLHRVWPQLVPVDPPSALTTVGSIRVLRKSTAAPSTSRIRLMGVFSLLLRVGS